MFALRVRVDAQSRGIAANTKMQQRLAKKIRKMRQIPKKKHSDGRRVEGGDVFFEVVCPHSMMMMMGLFKESL